MFFFLLWISIILALKYQIVTHKNPQRLKIIHGVHPMGCKDQLINMCHMVCVALLRLNWQFCFIQKNVYLWKYPGHVISVEVIMAVV